MIFEDFETTKSILITLCMLSKQGRCQGVWLGVEKCFDAALASQKECAASPEKGCSVGGWGEGIKHIFSCGKIYIMR